MTMGGKFHATFKSRSDNVMELVFDDAPWGGATTLSNVEVEIFERDKSLNKKEEPSKDDKLGTLTVDLEQGALNTHGRPTIAIKSATFREPINPAPINSGTFDLIAGPETFRLTVFMESSEWPHDKDPPWSIKQRNFIELALVIRAPGKPTYSSLKKGVRPDRLTALRGPVITYIAKPPGKEVFADNAEAHWKPRSDRLVRPTSGIMSLEEIIDDLHKDIGFDVVWKQVNIVTHGNLAGLLLPLTKADGVKELTHLDVRRLKPTKFKALDEGQSHVVIRGCSIGRDTDLLAALSQQFGNCKVFAPKVHLVAYAHHKQTRELLYRRFWAFTPGPGTSVSPGKIAKLLDDQKATMPVKPTTPFDKMVKKTFSGTGIPDFFRRKSKKQVHTLGFPEKEEKRDEFLTTELGKDPGLRNGSTQVAKLLASKGTRAEIIRAELTQPDHAPLSVADPLWKDFEAWKKHGHWGMDAKNDKDEVLDPGDPDPTHAIRAVVVLRRVKVEACELEGDITDIDVRTSSEFGSS